MAKNYVLVFDQGTTGTTTLLMDITDPKDPIIAGKHNEPFPQHYPQPGWVEHDLEEIWQTLANGVQQIKQQKPDFDPNQIAGIGITNQRETVCCIQKSGQPLYRAIVWQCRRSTDICHQFRLQGLEGKFKEKTGLVLDPYFSGTKIKWLLDNVPSIKTAVDQQDALFCTIDAYLVYRLTGGKTFATEPSNASRTLFFDIHQGAYDPELCRLMGLDNTDCLPEVRDSASHFGQTADVGFLPDGIPICGVLGDQQAALAGQTCFEPGEAKCTYGTGAFVLLNTGSQPLQSSHGLLTTVAWSLGGKYTYALEGSAFVAGAAIQFIRDNLNFIDDSPESETKSLGATAAPSIYFVPALAGLGAPHWDPEARGAFLGLTRGTSLNQLTRAALEGISFEVFDLVTAMSKDISHPISVLRVDGGGAANNLLMKLQSFLLQVEVDRAQNLETTAYGAFLFTCLTLGIYPDVASLKAARKSPSIFTDDMLALSDTDRQQWLAGWQRALKATQVFAGTESTPVEKTMAC